MMVLPQVMVSPQTENKGTRKQYVRLEVGSDIHSDSPMLKGEDSTKEQITKQRSPNALLQQQEYKEWS